MSEAQDTRGCLAAERGRGGGGGGLLEQPVAGVGVMRLERGVCGTALRVHATNIGLSSMCCLLIPAAISVSGPCFLVPFCPSPHPTAAPHTTPPQQDPAGVDAAVDAAAPGA